MSLVTAIHPLTGVKAKASRDSAKHAARDALAALVIEDAAFQGNPDASDFVGEANAFLGAARVHRLRAKRLRKKATRAAVMGANHLAEEISLAAEDEQNEAERLEGSLIRAVRESHEGVMGYVSPEEQKLLNWYAYKEQTSSASLGKQFEALSQKMIESAYNFGADEDEDEEVPLLGADDLLMAADVLGGDFEAVYGAYGFDDCYGIIKVSQSRLKKRLKRKKARLRKVERKLRQLENAGKAGLQVKFLTMRVNQLEKAIKRIKSKIKKTVKTEKVVKTAAADAQVQQAADSEVREESSEPSVDELDAKEEAEELAWLNESNGDDFGDAMDEDLFAAIDVYGLSQRRLERIRRRIARLKARLPHVTRERRRDRIERRIDRLSAKLEGEGYQVEADEAKDADAYTNVQSMAQLSTDAGDSYIDNYTYPKTRADSSLYFGGVEQVGERQPYLGFFIRRAGHYGAAVPNGQGDHFAGFWDGIKNFFSNLGRGTAKAAKATGQGIAKGGRATGQAVRVQWQANQAAREEAATYEPFVDTHRNKLRSQKEQYRQQMKQTAQLHSPGIQDQRERVKEERQRLSQLKKQRRLGLRAVKDRNAPGIQTTRRNLRKTKKLQRQQARAARKAAKSAARGAVASTALGIPAQTPVASFDQSGMSGPRYVNGRGGWDYLQQVDGTITITKAPSGSGAAGKVLRMGDPFWAEITQEIGPHPSQAMVGYSEYDDFGMLEDEMGMMEEELFYG